jgi:NAD(P)-dependent dehydrogenase (short-subunit alcohol dehydrogenase family)
MNTIIITGANGNLGTAVTQNFLKKGYHVIATVISEVDKKSMPIHSHLDTRVVNLTNSEETYKFANEVIEQYKKIDGLLMLVGGFAMGDIESTTLGDISKMFSLNFETAFNITQPLLRLFKKNNYGRFAFIGARPAIDAGAGKNMIAYSLSKSLLFKLAEFINADVNNKNIVASVIVPSVLDTPANRMAMPGTDAAQWVDLPNLAEVIEFIFNPKSIQIREPVYKIYNNA